MSRRPTRLRAWSRTSHGQSTVDVHNLTGMHQSSSFLSCSFFSCFLTKEEQRSARNCTRSWNWSAESKVYCRAGAALHCRSSLFVWESSKYCCLLKQMLNHPQASKQVDIVKVQLTWTQSGQIDPHAVTVLFLWPSYIHNVTQSEQKLYHSACSCPWRLRVWGRSKFTKRSLTLQEKALHFFFWISHCMLAVGGLETWTWWPHLVNFRWDVLIVVFSGSDSFSRIWSHGEWERERGSEIEQNLPLAWTSLSVACPTICMQKRDKRDSNLSSSEVRGEWQSAPKRRSTDQLFRSAWVEACFFPRVYF